MTEEDWLAWERAHGLPEACNPVSEDVVDPEGQTIQTWYPDCSKLLLHKQTLAALRKAHQQKLAKEMVIKKAAEEAAHNLQVRAERALQAKAASAAMLADSASAGATKAQVQQMKAMASRVGRAEEALAQEKAMLAAYIRSGAKLGKK